MNSKTITQRWESLGLSRRQFLKSVALMMGTTAFPFGVRASHPQTHTRAVANRVYVAKNGDYSQNTNKIWDMLGGPESYFDPNDVVIIKANAQWPNQGYTHTGCIKTVIDRILAMPGFNGEILICDNVQEYGSSGAFGFDATPGNRNHNWPDHNWNSLAAEYQGNGYPVATCRWYNSTETISGPADGEGWMRTFWNFHGQNSFFSYPIFQSPLSGNLIDMKFGVWSGGAYTGQAVKTIVMPNLNNHGWGSEDYAGVTSAVKSFLGATENHGGVSGSFQSHYNWHRTSFGRNRADYCGELTALYIQQIYAPILYITTAIWSGHESRTGGATQTDAVLACDNPATLDFVACRDVIGPYASFLDPTLNNNTRAQILGCANAGVGSIDPGEMSIELYDFDLPNIPAITLTGLFAALGIIGLEMLRSGHQLDLDCAQCNPDRSSK